MSIVNTAIIKNILKQVNLGKTTLPDHFNTHIITKPRNLWKTSDPPRLRLRSIIRLPFKIFDEKVDDVRHVP